MNNLIQIKKPYFDKFLNYGEMIDYVYGYANVMDENGNFLRDEDDAYLIANGVNININRNPLSDPYIRRLTNLLVNKYSLSDVTLLIGTQNFVFYNVSSIYGIIAKNKNGTGIIVFRGTVTPRDWITDFTIGKTKLNSLREFNTLPNSMKGFTGFVELYGNLRPNNICMSKQINDWVLTHPEIINYSVAGHSLGGALAQLAAFQVNKMLKKHVYEVYLYASARIFQPDVAKEYNNTLYNTTYNFYNYLDPVHAAPPFIVDIDKTLIGMTIFKGNSGCFQHVGRLLGIDYTVLKWNKDIDLLNKWHLNETFLNDSNYKNQWKIEVFDKYINTLPNPPNNLQPNQYFSKPTYYKFITYSRMLKTLYSLNNFLTYKFRPQNIIPAEVITAAQSFRRNYNITNIEVLCISDTNNIFFRDYVIPVGIIGKYNNKGIIILGNDYINFPEDLNFVDFIPSYMTSENITFRNLNINGAKIVSVFKDLFYTNCLNNKWCISKGIRNWINSNQNIKDFIVIGQGVGASFGALSILELLSNNKSIVESYFYGSARVGNIEFSNQFNTLVGNQTYTFLNLQDINTQLFNTISDITGAILDTGFNVFQHVGKLYSLDIPPPYSKCEFDSLLKLVRSPNAYLNVIEWKDVIEHNFNS